MSKHYFPLISLLSLLVLLIGSIAIYRSYFASPPDTSLALADLASPTPKATTRVLGAITTPIPPEKLPLTIFSPLAQASVSSSLLAVSGQTASQAAIKINDKPVITNPDGTFKSALRLTPGANLLVIEASQSGQSTIWQTVITYAP